MNNLLKAITVALCLVLGLSGASSARAEIAGEWLTGSGRLVFESLGQGRYHAVYSFKEALPGQVPIEFDGRLEGLVFQGHWISHWATALGSQACATERNGSPYWGWLRLEFDPKHRRFAGLEGRCEEVQSTANWLGRRALTRDDASPRDYSDIVRTALEAFPRATEGRCRKSERFGLVVHGGASDFRGNTDESFALVKQVLLRGKANLRAGVPALDTVEWSIRTLEDSGLFAAGRGATANQAGVVELDASIMEGRQRKAGAVAAVTRTRNPISGARLVMERSPHVLMVGPGADRFVAGKGGETAEQDYFRGAAKDFSGLVLPADLTIEPPDPNHPKAKTDFLGLWVGRWYGYWDIALAVERIGPNSAKVVFAFADAPDWGRVFGGWHRTPASLSEDVLEFYHPGNLGHHYAVEMLGPDTIEMTYRNKMGAKTEAKLRRWTKEGLPGQHGTVGAVALDRCGNLAAGTSTSGYGSKPPGRVGDSPIIGAGTYADNATAAISATGHGEYFIRFAAAHDIAAMMEYTGASLEEAASHVIKKKLFAKGLSGGVIAIDRAGNIAMPYNTSYMLRGAVTDERPAFVEYD